MRLSDWCRSADLSPTTPTTERGAVPLVVPADFRARWQDTYSALWRLDDYAVSSVSGPIVWLVPIQRTSTCPACGRACDAGHLPPPHVPLDIRCACCCQ